ncbi:MAG: SDR family NAD(P)-dependent oxidoreductase [Stappiaceae bacterium]
MQKTILITGSTDGIGLETAKYLFSRGHEVLVHGRNPAKLEIAVQSLSQLSGGGLVESYVADFSEMAEVVKLAQQVSEKHRKLDVLINNAGILKAPVLTTKDGFDVRFAVNTFAPYLLTQRLLPVLAKSSRVINLSSAAQAPVDEDALVGQSRLVDMEAYAQSKLALTMWSRVMALSLPEGPAIVAVNPGSMLGSKMVKEGFGVAGGDLRVGADILVRAALDDEFQKASGQYFDNDRDRFASPHPDALDPEKSQRIVTVIERQLTDIG